MLGDLDYKALSFYLALINSFGVVLCFGYTWQSNKHKANQSAIKDLSDVVAADAKVIEGRFSKIESEIKHLPTIQDIGSVYERVNAIAGTLSKLEGEVGQINNGLHLLHAHLLSSAKGR